jgi:hypothetical protein
MSFSVKSTHKYLKPVSDVSRNSNGLDASFYDDELPELNGIHTTVRPNNTQSVVKQSSSKGMAVRTNHSAMADFY